MGAEGAYVEVPPHVLDYLREQKTMTLATSSPTGVPRAATLTFVNDGPTFYIWTHPETTTSRHISQNPLVSFAIDEYADDWRETKGVQGTGQAQVVLNPSEVQRAVGLFSEKFAQVEDRQPANISFFRIEASDLSYIDAAAGGGGSDQTLGLEYQREVVFNVFRELPAQEVAAVAQQLQPMRVDAGEVIVRQGAPADKFFIIVDGEVEVVRDEKDGERKLATMGRGQFFGEMAILRDAPRSATVRAVTPVELLAMDKDSFRGLVGQSLGTTQQFDDLIKERLYRHVAGGAE